jgi:hypothetical protein
VDGLFADQPDIGVLARYLTTADRASRRAG